MVEKSKQLVTLADCVQFMPAVARKALLAQYNYLAATELPPGPVDMAPFWANVESAIFSLDPSFRELKNPLMFTARHVGVFGPLVLGAVGWQ